jgi:hypothetical protein
MNKENTSKLWKMIQETGDYLLCQWTTLADTSYAGNLIFIKNKSHRNSLIMPVRLVPKLVHLEINQMVNSSSFC